MNHSRIVVFLLLAVTAFAQNRNRAHEVVRPAGLARGHARPHSWMIAVTDPAATAHGPGQANCSTTGNLCYYTPADVTKAYSISYIANGNGGAGMTVGIVDAFYNSQTEADLGTFSTQFSLPDCTIANGCLTIVSQTGGAPTAGSNAGWAQETDLDVQWVHAIAPNAKILLVTGNSTSFTDLNAAVTYATAHANVVTNSYGGAEFAGEGAAFDSVYSSSTVPLLFSSGDVGAVTEYPCMSAYVTCVGGTSLLTTATGFRNTEGAWGGATTNGGSGGGCSTGGEFAPSFQTGFNTCGTARGVPDIAAIADPYTGVIVVLGTFAANGGGAGNYIFGGTSLASPVTAAVIATIDTARAALSKAPISGPNLTSDLYQAAAGALYRYRFYDVTTGTSGFAAGTGWDKATGLGVALGPSLANYLISLP